MPVISGGSGGGGPAAGTYLPVATEAGVTLDTTSYTNPLTGTDKLATLVFPPSSAILSAAIANDAFPRLLYFADPNTGGIVAFGDGTFDPYLSGGGISVGPTGALIIVAGGPADFAAVYFNSPPVVAYTSAPADALINPGDAALWFDKTNGASKLMIKARSADGTLVTGSVALA